MVIRKEKDYFVLDISENDVILKIMYSLGSVSINLRQKTSNSDVVIEKPGDFEYSKVTINCYEVIEQEEKYKGLINYVNISIGNNHFVFIPSPINLKDDTVSIFDKGDIVLLVDPNSSETWIKEMYKFFEPSKIVFLNKIDNINIVPVTPENVTESNSLKIKLGEILDERKKDQTPFVVVILN